MATDTRTSGQTHAQESQQIDRKLASDLNTLFDSLPTAGTLSPPRDPITHTHKCTVLFSKVAGDDVGTCISFTATQPPNTFRQETDHTHPFACLLVTGTSRGLAESAVCCVSRRGGQCCLLLLCVYMRVSGGPQCKWTGSCACLDDCSCCCCLL